MEASMAEAFITEEAANFVTAHYEVKNHHLHNPMPWYNDGDPKKVDPTSPYSKGSSHQPVLLKQKRWMLMNGGPFHCISSTT